MNNPLLIAFYLPQFHPVPENDTWWGKGFTEWTNVAKARPLYPGHNQPRVPADLGFYDLRVPETRQAQADLAAEYGIGAFCYYHYWFAGRRILERPFQEVLESRKPNFPFLLCWANQSWTGTWFGAPDRILIEQTYPGAQDHERHFQALLPAFSDPRYVRVDGKPVFLVWRPTELPDPSAFIEQWRSMAQKAGLAGLHLVAIKHMSIGRIIRNFDTRRMGFDAEVPLWMPPVPKEAGREEAGPTVYRYERIYRDLLPGYPPDGRTYPCVKPNWDNTPRSGRRGMVFEGATPDVFRRQLRAALDWTRDQPPGQRLVFVKAWNEWAEGNHLEPDQAYGRKYLEVVRSELERDLALARDLADPWLRIARDDAATNFVPLP